MKDKSWALYKITAIKDETFSSNSYAEGKVDGLDQAIEIVSQIEDVRSDLNAEVPDKIKAYIQSQKNYGRKLYQALEIAPMDIYKWLANEDNNENFAKYWVLLENEINWRQKKRG